MLYPLLKNPPSGGFYVFNESIYPAPFTILACPGLRISLLYAALPNRG